MKRDQVKQPKLKLACNVTIGPAYPALQGASFQGGAKLLENAEHFLENSAVVLAKVPVFG